MSTFVEIRDELSKGRENLMTKAMMVGAGMVDGAKVSSPTMPDQLEDIDKQPKSICSSIHGVVGMADYKLEKGCTKTDKTQKS